MTFATNSDQYASQLLGSAKGSDIAKLKVAFFKYTHAAGSLLGTVELVKLPPGKIRILVDRCRIVTSQMASTP